MTRLETKQDVFKQFMEYYDWLDKHPEAMRRTAEEAWEYYLETTMQKDQWDKEEIDRCPRTGYGKA